MGSAPRTLDELISALGRGDAPARLPPVHLWNPTVCGVADFEIRADGSWWHEGGRITREPLVRLFASILRKDPDGVYLVTPGEKVKVRIEDAPFLAVRADQVEAGGGPAVALTTNLGDTVLLGPDHPLRIEMRDTGEPRPYVEVRRGLEARILRAPFYEMCGWAERRGERWGVASMGAFFPLDPGGAP